MKAVLEAVAPDVLEDTASQAPTPDDDDALVVESPGTTSVVPTDPSTPLVLSSAGSGTVSISLPFSDRAADAVVVDDGVVSYDNGNESTTVPAVKDDGSVQVTTIIDSDNAPTRYDYALGLPEGASLVTDAESGGIVIVGSDGAFLGGVAPAWARDANGAAVATHYEVAGTTITQVVETTPQTAYPVVADPFLGISIISSVSRVNNREGLTYAVRPTVFGRAAAEWIHASYGWSEAVSKGVPSRQGLKEQYVCHPMSQVARVKSSWNLDTWRPTVGLMRTLAAACNP
ncbi:hypothetical protein DQ237_14715 [Blastococcus sp. TF02-8]|uniref:DUF2599 domain-containing protein n=1 Tax=Blastococcus sp. TF02-8 TaxID=2250574 RepID=UPI000DE98C36|nr:DUF2599 domain-containing protein [Blastococcus sp. TF02-8]RBY95320.1 hypothetical protein DQ237_14715 [Blastococcus sp. TF02-8]